MRGRSVLIAEHKWTVGLIIYGPAGPERPADLTVMEPSEGEISIDSREPMDRGTHYLWPRRARKVDESHSNGTK